MDRKRLITALLILLPFFGLGQLTSDRGSVSSINELTDVSGATPTGNTVLGGNGTNWTTSTSFPLKDSGGPSGDRVAYWKSTTVLDGEGNFSYQASQNRMSVDVVTHNPISSTSATAEGSMYYDSDDDELKLRIDSNYRGITATLGEFTPTSTSDTTGELGNIAYDGSFIYIKTSTGWLRASLSSF